MLGLMWGTGTVQAQDEASSASTESAWTVMSVELLRWPDSDQVVATVDLGTKVDVLVWDEQTVRVRSGVNFGWVARDQLTLDAPEPAEPTPSSP
ncbi:MAG: hypothetical protein QGG40_07190 [Myxococcota bacterium]|nr:hypothetical protein [Myxococcota bacterium]